MATIWERIRNLFSRKETRQEKSGGNNGTKDKAESSTAPKNACKKGPHPYEDVDVDEDGAALKSQEPNEFQKARPKLRPYDEVDVEPEAGVAVR